MKFIFTIIFFINSFVILSQTQKVLDNRFYINKEYKFVDEVIKLPKQLHYNTKEASAIETEKVNFYIRYFLNEKQHALKQAIFKQGLYFSYYDTPILADLAISLSGFEQNYFNSSFPIAAKYGLNMNQWIDERLDFIKSFEVAKKWMKQLSSQFSTPQETILAFINTPSGLKKAQIRAKSNVLDNYYIYLPAETQNVYFIQIAIHEIITNSVIETNKIFYYYSQNHKIKKQIIVKKEVDINIYEKLFELEVNEIKSLNPVLIANKIPENFILNYSSPVIPKQLDSIYFYQDSIINNPNFISDKKDSSIQNKLVLKDIYYKVKKGDNLFLISNWYNLDVQDIQIWNNLNNENIYAGQVLKLWVDQELAFDLSKINFLSLEAKNELLDYTSFQEILKNYKYYTVKKGDSLWLISQRYQQVTSDDIMKWNGISTNIEVGQKILIKIGH